jgi:transposase-like protein
MKYRFYLECPRCSHEAEFVTDNYWQKPRFQCGDCLMDRVEIVEMKVVTSEQLPTFSQ